MALAIIAAAVGWRQAGKNQKSWKTPLRLRTTRLWIEHIARPSTSGQAFLSNLVLIVARVILAEARQYIVKNPGWDKQNHATPTTCSDIASGMAIAPFASPISAVEKRRSVSQ